VFALITSVKIPRNDGRQHGAVFDLLQVVFVRIEVKRILLCDVNIDDLLTDVTTLADTNVRRAITR